jgi:hypothetical protein
LGVRFSYPDANAAGFVVLALALLGGAATASAASRLARELYRSHRLTGGLVRSVIGRVDGALVVPGAVPGAFCVGLRRPAVYVTTAAVEALDPQALQAVLLHEREHARRHDPLRFALTRVMCAALFFLPAVAALGEERRTLAEVRADEAATASTAGGREGLARAMLTLSEQGGVEAQRVDQVLGLPHTWRFPALLCALSIGLLALIAGTAVVASGVARGSMSLTLPLLSSQPCILVLAAVAVLVTAVLRPR